jgi:putative NADH-flavin reductase
MTISNGRGRRDDFRGIGVHLLVTDQSKRFSRCESSNKRSAVHDDNLHSCFLTACVWDGRSVRAMARSTRRIPVDHPKLEKMAGDALEMTTVKRALTGVDVVIQTLGVPAGPEIIFKPTQFFSKATRVLVTAIEQAQVKRLICVTGFGAGDSRGRGGFLYRAVFHLLLGRLYDDKDVQEWIIRRSKLDWVIERPVILTDGPKTNAYRALVDLRSWTFGFISRADVADFLVKQIDDDAFLHKTPVLKS